GHAHRSEIVELQAIKATPEMAAALGLREGHKVFRSVLVHYDNELPVQIEERFVNPKAVPEYLDQDFSKKTPYAYLIQLAPITEGKHVVEAILPDPEEAKLLKVKRSDPCLLINRTTWSGQQVVTVARLVYPGSRYRLEGRFGS
ncbi:MAG: UTRA domain-containing protein, partial [Pseudomonas sp.]